MEYELGIRLDKIEGKVDWLIEQLYKEQEKYKKSKSAKDKSAVDLEGVSSPPAPPEI